MTLWSLALEPLNSAPPELNGGLYSKIVLPSLLVLESSLPAIFLSLIDAPNLTSLDLRSPPEDHFEGVTSVFPLLNKCRLHARDVSVVNFVTSLLDHSPLTDLTLVSLPPAPAAALLVDRFWSIRTPALIGDGVNRRSAPSNKLEKLALMALERHPGLQAFDQGLCNLINKIYRSPLSPFLEKGPELVVGPVAFESSFPNLQSVQAHLPKPIIRDDPSFKLSWGAF